MPSEWTDYFTAVAGISATLLGLAFVAFTLSSGWHEKTKPLLRIVAIQTLAELLVPVLIGLSALMPVQPWHDFVGWSSVVPDTQWQLIAIMCGVAGLALAVWHITAYRSWARSRVNAGEASHETGRTADESFDRKQVWLDGFPLASYSAVLLAGLFGWPGLLAGALLWLIFSGSVEAFWFLSHRDELKNKTADTGAGREPAAGQASAPDATPA